MNREKLLTIIKRIWTVLIILALIYYFSKNYAVILEQIKDISWIQFVISAALLVIGKLFLAEMSRLSVISDQWQPTYNKIFHLYSTIQLSKYLPGGIWHFVGRFGVYRVNGLSNSEASRSIIVENIWLVSSALLFGSAVSLTNPSILWLVSLTPATWLTVLFILACLMVWIAVILVVNRIFIKRRQTGLSVVRQLLIQGAVWLFIGLSFFALLPVKSISLPSASLAIGGFAVAWAVGYATIFAPSGIGIREAVITAILATQLSAAEAALYAAISRLVWIITEISLGVITEMTLGSGSLRRLFTRAPQEEAARTDS